MSSMISKADLLSKYGNKVSNEVDTFYEKMIYFARIGFVTGLFPFKNCFTSTTLLAVEVKKISWQFLYSILVLIFKGAALRQFLLLQDSYIGLLVSEEKDTDVFVSALAFYTTFYFGPVAHFLCLWKISSFLEFFQSVEIYDKQYFSTQITKAHLSKSFMLYNALVSFIIVYIPVYMFFKIMDSEQVLAATNGTVHAYPIIPGLLETNDILLTCILVNIALISLELGTTYIHTQMMFTTRILTSRLEDIINLIQRKYELKEISPLSDFVLKPPTSSWSLIGKMYPEFLSIFDKYQHFIGPYFLILSGVLVTSYICMFYFLLIAKGEIVEERGMMLYCVLAITSGRIVCIANCGETLRTKYKSLVLAMMTAYQKDAFEESEKSQFKRLLNLITSSKIRATASGFFIVRRSNITSIIGLIITYFVVLWQFNNSSEPDSTNQNSLFVNTTGSTNMNLTSIIME